MIATAANGSYDSNQQKTSDDSMINNVRIFRPNAPNGKRLLYMHGYRARIWMARRQINYLVKQGYEVTAMDFIDVLKYHRPDELIRLMDEVDEYAIKHGFVENDMPIIGVSLGGLVGYNLLRRHPEMKKLIIITGGDMAKVIPPWSINKWQLTRDEIRDAWKDVNMYTPVGNIQGKHAMMLLPKRDRLIDPDEVIDEINLHREHNTYRVVRTNGGHFRTVISETIISPHRITDHLESFNES